MFNNDTIMNEAPHMSAGGLRISTEALSNKSISAEKQIDVLQKHIQNQDERFATLRRQFVLIQNTLQKQVAINQEQASEIASLKTELHRLRSAKATETPSSPNPFMDLPKSEIIKKLDIAEQKNKFFKEKGSINGALFDEIERILQYVAVNAISILSPGIMRPGSINEIFRKSPKCYLASLLDSQQFGQSYASNCVQFIKKGRNSSNPFLSFLYNTIQHLGEFKRLKADLVNRRIDEQKASQILMSLICKYGLDELFTSIIKPEILNDPDVASEYESSDHATKRLLHSYKSREDDYERSFALWPFNEFVPVVVDPEGCPGHYLTSLFINHFNDSSKPVTRVKIDSPESVELEIKQLKEALKSKK